MCEHNLLHSIIIYTSMYAWHDSTEMSSVVCVNTRVTDLVKRDVYQNGYHCPTVLLSHSYSYCSILMEYGQSVNESHVLLHMCWQILTQSLPHMCGILSATIAIKISKTIKSYLRMSMQ